MLSCSALLFWQHLISEMCKFLAMGSTLKFKEHYRDQKSLQDKYFWMKQSEYWWWLSQPLSLRSRKWLENYPLISDWLTEKLKNGILICFPTFFSSLKNILNGRQFPKLFSTFRKIKLLTNSIFSLIFFAWFFFSNSDSIF